ncbi:DUF6192 family protein [Streptomyces vinaceus]|uniref:DUF6192 family protein n=1 Tax=Streptomyces vinaceus TaxID=1960 RepID=UPI0035DE1D42
MRDDTTRPLLNRARFDNSERAREPLREGVPAVRKIEPTIEYSMVGACFRLGGIGDSSACRTVRRNTSNRNASSRPDNPCSRRA